MTKTFWRERYEWVTLAGASLLLLASAIWWWTHRPVVAALRREPVAARLSGSTYVPIGTIDLGNKVPAWQVPPAQSHGAGWRYELFTPPVVYYQASTRNFVVTPPVTVTGEFRPFEFELVEVKPQPYRLQLIGYVGEPGDYVAAFSSPDRAETLLARAGQRIEPLGVSLKSIEVSKMPFEDAEGRPAFDWAARAILNDERTGDEVVLDSRSRRFTGKLTAVLRRSADTKVPSREVEEGDVLLQENVAYRVTRIQLAPPQVVIERATGNGEAEQLTLTPAGGGERIPAAKPAGVRPMTADAAGSVVAADRGR